MECYEAPEFQASAKIPSYQKAFGQRLLFFIDAALGVLSSFNLESKFRVIKTKN